jgi:hypothetical protein
MLEKIAGWGRMSESKQWPPVCQRQLYIHFLDQLFLKRLVILHSSVYKKDHLGSKEKYQT